MSRCYVLMPFHESYSDLYEKAIRPAVEECIGEGECQRADRDTYAGVITDKIVTGIVNSEIVIAVITGNNPNVMYELGLAHTMRKPTVILASRSEGTSIPFDIGSQEAVFYEYDPEKTVSEQAAQLRTIKAQVSEYLASLASGAERSNNPIANALQGRNLFVDDLREWLWGYSDVYERERNAEVIWEMTPNPHWVTRDPLFNRQILESLREERQKFYYLVPNTKPVIAEMKHLVRSLEREIGSDEVGKVHRGLRYVTLDEDFFELLPFSVVIYDAIHGTRADAIICEPMAPEIGEDKDYDGQLIRMGPEGWAKLSRTDMMSEDFFDIRLAEQKVRKLTWTFMDKWNDEIKKQIDSEEDDEVRRLLQDHWKL